MPRAWWVRLAACLFAVVALSALQSSAATLYEWKLTDSQRQPGDTILNLAQKMLARLQRSSESGIYETLKLHRILSATAEEGVFHRITRMLVELSSPFLISPSESAKASASSPGSETVGAFQVVVMEPYDDSGQVFTASSLEEKEEGAKAEPLEGMVDALRRRLRFAIDPLPQMLPRDSSRPDVTAARHDEL